MRYLRAFQTANVNRRIGALIAVAILLLVTTVLLSDLGGDADDSATSGTPEGITTVASPDGLAVLEIPDGALPDGITAADVTVNAISLDDRPAMEGLAVAAAYEFLPNGLELRTPAALTIRVRFEVVPGALLIAHESDNAWELLPIVDSDFDEEEGTVTLSTLLSHFSVATLYRTLGSDLELSEMIDLDLNPLTVDASVSASKVHVGNSFEFSATLATVAKPGLYWSRAPNAANLQDGKFELFVTDDPVMFKGRLNTSDGSMGSGPVTPTRVDEPSGWTPLTGGSYEFKQTLECVDGGTASMTYWMYGKVPIEARKEYLIDDKLTEGRSSGHISTFELDGAFLECVMPKIVASAAPPVTTYTLSPEISTATHFAWSGADCGSVTGSTTNTMAWSHGSEDCEHAGEAHPASQITVLVTGNFPESGTAFEMRCNYQSAASGAGAECVLKR